MDIQEQESVIIEQLGKLYLTGYQIFKTPNSEERDTVYSRIFHNVDLNPTYPEMKFVTKNSASHTYCAIDLNGNVWTMGRWILGRSSGGEFNKIPAESFNNEKIVYITTVNREANPNYNPFYNGFLAVSENGSLYAWGNIGAGLSGDSSTSFNSNFPVKIEIAPPNIKKIYYYYMGSSINCFFALDKDGKLWSWGDRMWRKYDGRNADSTNIFIPGMVNIENKKIVDFTVEGNTGQYVLDDDGNIWKWNSSYSPYIIYSSNPENKIIKLKSVTKSGSRFFCVLKEDGTVHAWGQGLIPSDYMYKEIPLPNDISNMVYFPLPEKIVDIPNLSLSKEFYIYYKGESGRIYSSGGDSSYLHGPFSVLGSGDIVDNYKPVPTEVVGLPLENIIKISAKNKAGEDIPGISVDITRTETQEIETAQIGENYVLGHGTFKITAYGAPEEYYPADPIYLPISTQGKEYNTDFVFQERKIGFEGSITVSSNVPNAIFSGNKDIVFENGVAQISQPGDYEVTASAEGYYTQTVVISVPDASGEADVNYIFELEKIPEPEPEPDQEDDYWLSNQPYFNRENLNIGEAK